MRIRWISFALFSLLLAACGGGGGDSSSNGVVVDDTPIDFSLTPTQVDGVWYVPDFEFVLADGSSFATADSDLPVYIMFWAEW